MGQRSGSTSQTFLMRSRHFCDCGFPSHDHGSKLLPSALHMRITTFDIETANIIDLGLIKGSKMDIDYKEKVVFYTKI